MAELAASRVTPEESAPSAWLYYLHGIYGAGRNWASVARGLARRRPDWGGLLVDLRLHGASRDFEPPHTLEACARDLRELAAGSAAPAPPAAILGHSFGGKVALMLARDPPNSLRQLWIVDSTPAVRPPAGSAVRMLRAVREAPGPFATRDQAIETLESRGFDSRVATWMVTNLESGDGGMRWRLDPDEMEALLADFFRTDLWEVVEVPPAGLHLHFLAAEDSGVLAGEDAERIRRAGRETGRVHLHPVAGGHWLNDDNPDAVVDLLAAHLPDPGS